MCAVFILFNNVLFRTKDDEIEELKLREELKGIDTALKKYKKLVSFINLLSLN